jgi:methionyl-tRNA synthetase
MPPGSGTTVVITPPPTPNGPLHVGHLSGPYVAGDIAVRAARARGERVLSVSGLDVHQNYVLTAAEREGRPPAEVIADYGTRIRSALALSGVSYDLFLDPAADADYRDAVARLLSELLSAGAIAVREVPWAVCSDCGRDLHHARVAGTCRTCGQPAAGGACEGCATYAAAVDLVDPRCTACGGVPRVVPTALPVLVLEEYRDLLTEAWSRAVVPARVRDLFDRMLTDGLPEVPLAYPTDWGIPLPGTDTRIDVWVEMAIGYLYAVPRQLGTAGPGDLAACRAGWSGVEQMWHFLGIDNAFYYAVLTPAVLLAAGLPAGLLGGLVVNEFYALDGLKFSTSRRHAVWAEDFLAKEDPALVRLQLAWDRPAGFASDFTPAAYEAFREWAGPLLAGESGPLPSGVAEGEVDRAAAALRLEQFDPALAARCLLGALGGPEDARARELLAAVTGR